MQNPPPMQPPTMAPGVPYPMVVQPVADTRSNGDAVGALILGILAFISTFVVVLVIANYSNTDQSFVPLALILFMGGSFFALPSIACGKAGLATCLTYGGELKAATGLAFGYFFYISYFVVLLLHLFKA